MADDLIQKGGLLPQLQFAALAGIDQYERIAMREELAHGEQNAERGTRKGDMRVHAIPCCGRDQGGYRNQHKAQQRHRDLQQPGGAFLIRLAARRQGPEGGEGDQGVSGHPTDFEHVHSGRGRAPGRQDGVRKIRKGIGRESRQPKDEARPPSGNTPQDGKDQDAEHENVAERLRITYPDGCR